MANEKEKDIDGDEPGMPTVAIIQNNGSRSPDDKSVDNPAFTLRADTLEEDLHHDGSTSAVRTAPTDGAGKPNMNDVNLHDEGFGGAPNVRRDRPFSASMASRRTTASMKSRASLSSSKMCTDYASNKLFSYREGVLEQAAEVCKNSVVRAELDGQVQGFWLLTEIDHWDYEREKFVLLTDHSLLVIKFDFIKVAVYDSKRIYLNTIKEVKIGDLVYPSTSVMPARDHGGLRIIFGNPALSFFQRWNPWSQSVPYITFTHHLLIYNRKEMETVTFNVDDLADSLLHGIEVATQLPPIPVAGVEPRKEKVIVEEGPILIESYASVATMIHNQSKLGFNLERGGVSY